MQTLQIRLTKELIAKAQELVDEGLYSNKSEVIRDSLRHLVFNKELSMSEKKKFKIIFTADLHGNIVQYKKLFARAFDSETDAVIIGGDICPKDKANRTIQGQRNFILNDLLPIIKAFHKKNSEKKHNCLVFLMMGNDDFKSNYQILEKIEKTERIFKLIHNKCVTLHESYKIAGYSFVPLTPFRYKDWEKLDTNKQIEKATRGSFTKEGVRSKDDKLIPHRFDLNKRNKTIEKDLTRILRKNNEKTLLITHAPPFDTSLDMISEKEHVGSIAIRNAIIKLEPLSSFHGHVHETERISKTFKDKLGKTPCFSVANDHLGKKLAILEFNLFDINNIKRQII